MWGLCTKSTSKGVVPTTRSFAPRKVVDIGFAAFFVKSQESLELGLVGSRLRNFFDTCGCGLDTKREMSLPELTDPTKHRDAVGLWVIVPLASKSSHLWFAQCGQREKGKKSTHTHAREPPTRTALAKSMYATKGGHVTAHLLRVLIVWWLCLRSRPRPEAPTKLCPCEVTLKLKEEIRFRPSPEMSVETSNLITEGTKKRKFAATFGRRIALPVDFVHPQHAGNFVNNRAASCLHQNAACCTKRSYRVAPCLKSKRMPSGQHPRAGSFSLLVRRVGGGEAVVRV